MFRTTSSPLSSIVVTSTKNGVDKKSGYASILRDKYEIVDAVVNCPRCCSQNSRAICARLNVLYGV